MYEICQNRGARKSRHKKLLGPVEVAWLRFLRKRPTELLSPGASKIAQSRKPGSQRGPPAQTLCRCLLVRAFAESDSALVVACQASVHEHTAANFTSHTTPDRGNLRSRQPDSGERQTGLSRVDLREKYVLEVIRDEETYLTQSVLAF